MMYEKKSRPFPAENLESSILRYVIWRHLMKINFQNTDPMADLGNFHPTCAERGLNGVTMRCTEKSSKRSNSFHIYTSSKHGQQMMSLYSWQMDDTCQTSMYITDIPYFGYYYIYINYSINTIYIYIWILSLLVDLHHICHPSFMLSKAGLPIQCIL